MIDETAYEVSSEQDTPSRFSSRGPHDTQVVTNKKKNKMRAILALCLVVLIAAIGVAAYFFISTDESTDNTTTDTTPSVIQETFPSEAPVEGGVPPVEGEVPPVEGEVPPVEGIPAPEVPEQFSENWGEDPQPTVNP